MMSEFKIEKNVPVPMKRHKSSIFPFAQMEIGDSFFVEADKDGRSVEQRRAKGINVKMASARNTATTYAYRSGKNFITRQILDDKEQLLGVRIWRIKKENK